MSKITILPYQEGARRATGSAVIIDTYRASPVIAGYLALGAQAISPARTIDQAREKATKLIEYGLDILLAGEENLKTPKDFNFGNSLVEVLGRKDEIQEKNVVLVSSNGIQGILNAFSVGANEVLVGSFANRSSLMDYLKNTTEITLCPVGESWGYAEEDMLFAYYFKQVLGWRVC